MPLPPLEWGWSQRLCSYDLTTAYVHISLTLSHTPTQHTRRVASTGVDVCPQPVIAGGGCAPTLFRSDTSYPLPPGGATANAAHSASLLECVWRQGAARDAGPPGDRICRAVAVGGRLGGRPARVCGRRVPGALCIRALRRSALGISKLSFVLVQPFQSDSLLLCRHCWRSTRYPR